MKSGLRQLRALLLIVSLFSLLTTVSAREKAYIQGTGIDGETRNLDVSRKPALYTSDFADCLSGQSLFNVTKFDAAYYRDNLTVLFHLDGTTNIRNESLMMHISVEAYGENRFNMTYDPCKANIASLCPLNASVPITAFAVIQISPYDVAGIPSIALGIPDLEGFARLRIFSNSTQTEIGCFQAIMTNGQSFSQPQSVGSLLGIFVLLAVLASFATAIYGVQLSHMRTHYAHSFSILVIFETFQSIYFTGALSVDWPSVLPAWWSNFSWVVGMFAPDDMINAISPFAGISGNASQVGGAGSVSINNGGGLTQQIYGRTLMPRMVRDVGTSVMHTFTRRQPYNSSNPYDYDWAGKPRNPGLPIPGNFYGFAGTLSVSDIPDKDAFIIGLIWMLVALVAVALFVAFVKATLDLCVRMKWVKTDGFNYFRSHWLGYMRMGIMRALFIAFSTMMTLTLFQFSIKGALGPTVIGAVVFVAFLVGMGGVVFYACYTRLRDGKYEVGKDTIRFEQGKLFKTIPFVATTRESALGEEEKAQNPHLFGTLPFIRIHFAHTGASQPTSVHKDEEYVKRWGWLSARYRRTRWWFFAVYLAYQFVRACFIGGASQSPLAQVYGLFIFEILALFAIIKMAPFEGSRNMIIAIWLLSVSKIVSTGLAIALLPSFNLNRIVATVLGIVIIVVQGFLAVAVLVLIALGMISTWMSLSRNREEFPSALENSRVRYFEHIEARAADLPKPKKADEPPEPMQPTFSVREVRRAPKIEDMALFPSIESSLGHNGSNPTHPRPLAARRNRANSASSRYSVSSLPRSGRAHRASWSSKDFAEWDAEMNRGDQMRMSHMRSSSLRMQTLKGQGPRPMTPTRESAEFSRVSTNVMTPEERDAILQDSIAEAGDSPSRKGLTITEDSPTNCSSTSSSDASTKVNAVEERAVLTDGTKIKTGE